MLRLLQTALLLALLLPVAHVRGQEFNPVGALGARSSQDVQEETTYTVVAGDTLYGIALRFYGDGFDWSRIFEANRDLIKNPDLIYPGQQFRIPRGARKTPSVATTHEVQEGETLAGLAERYLGSRERWPEIYAANADRIRDPSKLEAGTELRIPEAGSSQGPAAPRSKPQTEPPSGPNPELERLARSGAVTTRSPQFSAWVSEALRIAEGWPFPSMTNRFGKTVTPADFLRAIIYLESRGTHSRPGSGTTRSSAGALGFMQLMPRTAAGLGVNPHDPRENLLGGTRYLGDTMKGPNTRNRGDNEIDKLMKAAAGYNRGPYADELEDKSWDQYVRTSRVRSNVAYGVMAKMAMGLELTGSERQFMMSYKGLSSAGVDDMANRYYTGSRALF